MKHGFLVLIAVLPLAMVGCCCIPTPVCMQPPGYGHYMPGPQFAPVGPMYRPYAPVVPVTCQPLPHQITPRFPVRQRQGLIRHGWPITQAYSTAAGEPSRSKCQTCSDCRQQCDCSCEDQTHVCDTQHADCAAPCGEGCAAEPGCYAPFDTGQESRVFMPPGAANGDSNSGLRRVEPPPVPPTPPAPNAAVPEPPREARIDDPSGKIRRVNYVSLNSSMPPEDYDRSHATLGLHETYERTTIPAKTVVHKRIE
jgi:hypothetical protein